MCGKALFNYQMTRFLYQNNSPWNMTFLIHSILISMKSINVTHSSINQYFHLFNILNGKGKSIGEWPEDRTQKLESNSVLSMYYAMSCTINSNGVIKYVRNVPNWFWNLGWVCVMHMSPFQTGIVFFPVSGDFLQLRSYW